MTTHTERTLPEVLQGAAVNIQEIIRSEFQLAKTVVKDTVARSSRPAAMLGAGIAISLYAAGFILLAIVYSLAIVMAAWLAALIVGAVLAIAAIVIISSARTQLKRVDPVPERTVETMKENMTWVKQQIK